MDTAAARAPPPAINAAGEFVARVARLSPARLDGIAPARPAATRRGPDPHAGWTSMALCTLALGTGANAGVFSFVDALPLQAAPGIHPERPLVAIYTERFQQRPYAAPPDPDYLSFKSDTTAFRHAAGARRLEPR
jgi:hypothetical protein